MEMNDAYFNPDPVRNPTMHDWSMAYLKYCDGASFSGRNMAPGDSESGPLHFRGHGSTWGGA